MMNKRGITFTRLLLYILFCLVLVGIIYIFITTYKALKNNETTQFNDSSMRFAYNNQYQYSAADNIIYCAPLWCKADDFMVSTTYNPFYCSYTDVSSGMGNYQKFPVFSDYQNYYQYSSQYFCPILKGDNVLNLGSMVTRIGDYINDHKLTGFNGVVPDFTTMNSLFMTFNCYIPINQFKCTFSGADLTTRVRMYYITDLDLDNTGRISNTSSWHYVTLTNGTYYLDLSQQLDSSVANATKIIYFGFGLYRNTTASYNYYLTSNNLARKTNFYNKLNDSVFDIKCTFDIFSGDDSYQLGYDTGYQVGKNEVDDIILNDNMNLQNQVNQLNLDISDLQSRVEQQSIIIQNLNDSLNDGSNFKNLFFTLADIPFATVHNALGFEFWGVNLFRFFTGVLTALGIIWLIKKIL